MNLSRACRIASLVTCCLSPLLLAINATAADNIEFFEREVRPVLAARCFSCHGPGQQFSSLRVDSREALLKGGNRGPAIVPGDPTLSLLAKAVRQEGLQMPVGGKLPPEQIAAIEKWITIGAPWPESKQPALTEKAGAPGFYERIRKEHWAYQPVHATSPPEVSGVSHPVDQFLVAALHKAGLEPAAPADRPTLIRRLSLTLTGLPPTPLEVDLFVHDPSPQAYEHLVDRLLASPHFGEQWARHWMDVMRFAETFGNDWNYEIKGAWLYRDYLIRAFNADVPYDQLIREHLAGDLLEKPRLNAKENINESLLGTSFLRLGELGHDDCIRFRQIRTDVVDNQIDTLGKAFQGLTIACARCHDHKLDPIPTSDYYGLYGALTSSRMVMRNASLPTAADPVKERLRQLKPRIREELGNVWLAEAKLASRYLLAADRAWKGQPPDDKDLAELSIDRIQAWVTLLQKAPQKQNPAPENPLYAWVQPDDWAKLKQFYETEAASRSAFNRDHFRPFGNLAADGFGGWHADGNALTDGPSASGEFAVASEGSRAVTAIFPSGIYTNVLSERLNGALRSPLVPKDKKFVSLQILGGKLGGWRTVLDNCMLSEDYQVLDRNSLAWVKIPNRTDQPKLPFYLELVTKTDNPRIPDRPGRLKATQQQIDSPYSYFGIARAVVHDIDEPPKDELSHMSRLFAGSLAKSSEAKAARYQTALEDSIQHWASGQASDDDARWLQWAIENGLLTNATSLTPRLHSLIEEYRFIESRIDSPKVFEGLADMDPGYNFPVLLRGDAENPGKVVPRGFLQLISGTSAGLQVFGSGRREIADLIASPTNPLTARVMVNRIWLHLFGRGIVPTADNFGTYGEPPSHPELLDYLAARFVQDGWSIKKQIRFLVLSQAFQQASRPSQEAQKIDALDRLLSHYPVHRMQGESIRDSILAVSGRLDPDFYGPSIQPYREEPKDYRKLYQGPLDGDGRRSIYLKVTRHEGSRFLETFDFPNPTVARGNRDTTNVPPQALALLNDPFVLEQAGFWADRLIAEKAPAEARIDTMFRTALGRLPNDSERARFVSLAQETASLHHVVADKLLDSHDVWKDVAHAIFNLKEFVYVR